MRSIKRQILDDKLYLWRARTLRRPYFHHGLDSPPLAEHLRALELELPRLGRDGRHAFTVTTLFGPIEAAIHVYAYAADAPVLIYHHSAGEVPATRTVREIFPNPRKSGLSIFVIEAPFHETAGDFKAASSSMMTYLAMQAVAIEVTERLLRSRPIGAAPSRAVAGYGQGGFIANLHHLIYDTAYLYVPFMAGTAPAETFLESLPTAGRARHKPEELRRLLNFDAQWSERAHSNVFPVLGSADVVNRFNTQARSYGDTAIEVWPLSHLAAAKSPSRLRAKIMRHIEEVSAARHRVIELTPERRSLANRRVQQARG